MSDLGKVHGSRIYPSVPVGVPFKEYLEIPLKEAVGIPNLPNVLGHDGKFYRLFSLRATVDSLVVHTGNNPMFVDIMLCSSMASDVFHGFSLFFDAPDRHVVRHRWILVCRKPACVSQF